MRYGSDAEDSPPEQVSPSKHSLFGGTATTTLIHRKADKVYSLSNNFHAVPMITAGMPLGGNGQSSANPADASGPGAAADLLRGDMDVFDDQVFVFCQKYLAIHQAQHKQMSREHAALDQKRIYSIPSFRARWNLILNLSQKTTLGRWVAGFEGVVVTLSILTIILESIPEYNGDAVPKYDNVWFLFELIITIYFGLFTAFRFAVASSVIEVVTNPMNWFDIVSLLPLFVQVAVQSRTYGWLKTLRLFRLVKLLRMFQFVDALVETLRRIASSLVAPFVLLAVFVVTIGNIMYWLEGGTVWTVEDAVMFINRTNYTDVEYIYSLVNHTVINDCTCESTAGHLFGDTACPPLQSGFLSAAHGMWYAVAAFTTTGYGDISPQCAAGKITTSIALLFSTVFIAMPIAIVGTSFATTVVDHHNKMMLHKKLKARSIRDLRDAATKQQPVNEIYAKKRARNNRPAAQRLSAHDPQTRDAMTEPIMVTKSVTACEGLFRFVASQLQVEHLDFNPESFCVVAPTTTLNDDDVSGGSVGEGGSSTVDETASNKTEDHHGFHHRFTRRIVSYRQLPLRAQYSAHLVDTMDAYISWLFEYWLAECLAGNLDPMRDVLRPPEAGVTVSTLVSPFARRSGMEERQAAYRERKRQTREDELRRAKASLWEVMQTHTGSLHHMSMLQSVDRAPGFAMELRLPTCCVTPVVSRPMDLVVGHELASRGGQRGNPLLRSGGENSAPTGSGLLMLSSQTLWLPDMLGTFEHFTTFATRHLIFTPHESCIDFISINGVPLVEVAALQHMSRLGDVAASHGHNEADVKLENVSLTETAMLIKRLRFAACLVDANKCGGAEDQVGSRVLSAFDAGRRGGPRAAARDHLTVERVFSVALRCGDVIDFTLELRTTEGLQNPPLSLCSNKLSGGLTEHVEIDANEVYELRQRRMRELHGEGIRSISYRVELAER
ncbi:ion transporter, putative [Bodo saltans]|uniref:Ion transporter, putative n=1 Tax=Bodo saltans TaxID=75058 RepID=A0A0S4KLB2_BODSA|nr:ion transporter, putative [Bodo saltans]|eukprot:CUI15404.1 ion transporter, putative [Bodo saltans]